MKPKIHVDYEKSVFTIKLTQEMSMGEVQEFLKEFAVSVNEFSKKGMSISVLIDAAEKYFSDLNTTRAFSQGFRKILESSKVNKVAVYRPQDDFHGDEELAQPNKIKTFVTLEDANLWLLQEWQPGVI